MEQAGIRGLGGAGFPAARKWRIVRAHPAPRLMAVNIDEGEPGTFKDRHYLERDPHRVLEGMLIAAHVVGAGSHLHLSARRIRRLPRHAGKRAGKTARGSALPPAAASSCGAAPVPTSAAKNRPCSSPSRANAACRGCARPTSPSRVSSAVRPWCTTWRPCTGCATFSTRAPRPSSPRAATDAKGLRSFSLSGRVKRPGVYLAPAGISARELIDEYGGGMPDGHRLKAYFPGGASGGILPAALADVPLDFDTLQEYGCFIGSAAVIVLSDHDSVRDAALNAMRFFARESCGQCTPCRVGHREGRSPHGATGVGPAVARGPRAGHGRRLHLRPRPGRAQSPVVRPAGTSPRNAADDEPKRHLHARRPHPDRSEPTRPSCKQRNATASRSLTCATRMACAPTATAVPAWWRSPASVPWRLPAADRPPPDMVVTTESPRARHAQRMVVELLTADAPATSLVPNNELAHWRRWLDSGHGAEHARHTAGTASHSRRTRPATDSSHPAITVDLDACILCTRCLRACREEPGQRRHRAGLRGHETRIVFDLDDPLGARPPASAAASAYRPAPRAP